MEPTLEQRARVHAALAEPHRLAIVDELAESDRTPSQLGRLLDLPSNLLAHHLDILDAAGLIERFTSSGDRRRRYVRLLPASLTVLAGPTRRPIHPARAALFVCTHNSARSQLAAALWTERIGGPARSAGTHPAERVHPRAVAAAARAGLDLGDAVPRLLDPDFTDDADLVVTVCDRANEELSSPAGWQHWSTPDPAATDDDAAFDATIAALDARIRALGGDAAALGGEPTTPSPSPTPEGIP